jgi:dephospho-CoA kinase
MLRIGLTGGIGSGKTSVSAIFASLGIPVIDADSIVHALILPGTPASRLIMETFGDEIMTNDGGVNRRKLAQQVFNRPSDRRKLEAILHPLVRAEIETRLRTLAAPYCVLEIPLLIEAQQQDLVDRILVVEASESARIRRIRHRDGRSESEIIAILASQASDTERRAAADDILHNDGSLDELQRQVQALHQKYLTLAANRQPV